MRALIAILATGFLASSIASAQTNPAESDMRPGLLADVHFNAPNEVRAGGHIIGVLVDTNPPEFRIDVAHSDPVLAEFDLEETGVLWNGYLNIPTSGNYLLITNLGRPHSVCWIGLTLAGQELASMRWGTAERLTENLPLEAGLHPISMWLAGGNEPDTCPVTLMTRGPGDRLPRTVPSEWFVHSE